MKIVTIEEVKEKVDKNSLNTCEYLSGFEDTKSTIQIKCKKHNLIFSTKYENVRRDNRAHHVCPICIQEDRDELYQKDRIELECAYCGKKFLRAKSEIEKSKSKLFFCCREHKDTAQKIGEGDKFDVIRPSHYGKELADYRLKALRYYPNECAVCKWQEDTDILEVHHIDENHYNNDIDNLIILCPICHRKITNHKYKLIDRKFLEKIK